MGGIKRTGGFVMTWAEGCGLIECEEIVFCKDCIYYAESPDPVDPGWPMYCEFTQQEMLGCNGFCAWGERRGE